MPDREQFLKQWESISDFLLLRPESEMQKVVLGVVAMLVLVFVLNKLLKFGKAARSGFFLSLGVVLTCAFFLLVTAVWGRHAIAELGLVSGQQEAALGLLLGLAFFAGVAPFTRFCFKAAYFGTVAAWMLSLLLAGGAVYGAKAGWEAASAPEKPVPGLQEGN